MAIDRSNPGASLSLEKLFESPFRSDAGKAPTRSQLLNCKITSRTTKKKCEMREREREREREIERERERERERPSTSGSFKGDSAIARAYNSFIK